MPGAVVTCDQIGDRDEDVGSRRRGRCSTPSADSRTAPAARRPRPCATIRSCQLPAVVVETYSPVSGVDQVGPEIVRARRAVRAGRTAGPRDAASPTTARTPASTQTQHQAERPAARVPCPTPVQRPAGAPADGRAPPAQVGGDHPAGQLHALERGVGRTATGQRRRRAPSSAPPGRSAPGWPARRRRSAGRGRSARRSGPAPRTSPWPRRASPAGRAAPWSRSPRTARSAARACPGLALSHSVSLSWLACGAWSVATMSIIPSASAAPQRRDVGRGAQRRVDLEHRVVADRPLVGEQQVVRGHLGGHRGAALLGGRDHLDRSGGGQVADVQPGADVLGRAGSPGR